VRAEMVRHHVEQHTDLAADLPHAYGDRIQLQQVLLNLIVASHQINGKVVIGADLRLIRCSWHPFCSSTC
jgi:nitrogen-specific signal transduction histidine kinase